MNVLQFYNDDFYNTNFWHNLILDLTLLLWTLATTEVLLCFLKGILLWNCIVFLLCVWVVLLHPPYCICKTKTNIQTKYLHCPANHMLEKYSKFKCKYVQNLWTKSNQTYIQNSYTTLQKNMSEMIFKLKLKH